MAFIAPSFFNFPYLATSPPAIVFFRIYTPAEVRSGYNEKITPGSSTAPSGRNMSSKIQFEERLGPKKSGFQVVEGTKIFSYCMSKQSCSFLYSDLLYIKGQDLLDAHREEKSGPYCPLNCANLVPKY